MARITAEREANLKEWENKPTGKMIFESMNKASFEDITFEEPEENEEAKEEDEEEMVEDFVYDRALFKPGEAEEEIDFDDEEENECGVGEDGSFSFDVGIIKKK